MQAHENTEAMLIGNLFSGMVAPFFILITLIANSAIVVVLSRKNMQTPTNTVLLGKPRRRGRYFSCAIAYRVFSSRPLI